MSRKPVLIRRIPRSLAWPPLAFVLVIGVLLAIATDQARASEPTPQFSGREETPNQSTQLVAGPAKRESSTQGGRVKPQPNIAGRPHSGVAERTRETLHRASTVARGVIEDEVKRVEKIRQVSSVVIEEASYDPSLRFVLVALVLFIVFIILLVLSKVMG